MILRYLLDDIDTVAKTLLGRLSHRLWIFDAPMGAGKTTLIGSICKHMGIHKVSSPTFSIVNDYDNGCNRVLHFDLYRIKNSAELVDIGFEEYLEYGAYVFIEWPKPAMPFLTNDIHNIKIVADGDYRILEVV